MTQKTLNWRILKSAVMVHKLHFNKYDLEHISNSTQNIKYLEINLTNYTYKFSTENDII